MISWQSIMSVFNTKGTLLKWLKTLDQSLKDGVLETVTVNSVSEGVITLSFNFADGSVITTPEIDIPHGAQGPQGIPGTNGANGKDGESFKPMGEWVTDNEYHPFDYVTYQGSSYLCTETIIDGTDAPPLDTAHWQLVAEKGEQGEPGTGPDIPSPTTADNGKVLGVTNGAYALQEASGGQLYQHNIRLKNTTKDFSSSRVYFSFINDVASPYTTVIQVAMALASMNLTLSSEGGLPATGLYSAYSDRVMCVVGSKGGSLTVIINTGSTISMQSSPSDEIVDYVTPL